MAAEREKAREHQRELLQGKGRPVVSNLANGRRTVIVGNKAFSSDKWLTFHDFLFDYIVLTLGQDWFSAELQRSEKEQHPIIQHWRLVNTYMKSSAIPGKQVQSADLTGAAALHLGLSYNLYLIAHNSRVESLLIKRLKNPTQYAPAQYETLVAAAFIQAGFELVPEDESDESVSHCEFTALHPQTGKKFSVEAKRRELNKATADVGTQLHKALSKTAAHERIVFIDLNAHSKDQAEERAHLEEAIASIRSREANLRIRGVPAPPAYVMITNYSFGYDLNTTILAQSVVAEGFKIPGFRADASFDSVHTVVANREKHTEMFQLLESIRMHVGISATFDGELPEFAFVQTLPRLEIGKTYLIPTDGGLEVPGVLYQATVSLPDGVAHGVCQLHDGKSVMVSMPLSSEEIVAYERSPDTFFGIYRPQGRTIRDPLDFYDFMYNTYRLCTKEQLLGFMADNSDFEELQMKSQDELAKLYCERMTDVFIQEQRRSQ